MTVSYPIGNGQNSFTYHLKAGDYQWIKVNVDETTTTLTGDAVDAGSYKLTITRNGLSNIRTALDKKVGSGNVKLPATHVTGDVDFTINKATPTASVTISGSKPYDGQPIYYQPTITVDAPGLTGGQKSIALSNGDYYWVKINADGTTSRVDQPTDVGSYTIVLTEQGRGKVTRYNVNADNLDWAGVKSILVSGSYTIKPASETVIPGHPAGGSTGSGSTSSMVSTAGSSQSNGQTKSRELPKTGNNDNRAAGLGLILASLSGIFGLAGLNKKRER